MKSEISGKKKKKKGEETQKRVCLFRKVRDFILEIERERERNKGGTPKEAVVKVQTKTDIQRFIIT